MASACAASGNTPLGQRRTAVAATRGNARLIVQAELAELNAAQTAWEAVERLHRNWLDPVRGASISLGPAYARVVVDRSTRGDLGELRSIPVIDIETIRFLSPSDAATNYGIGYPGGVIEVTTRSRAQGRASPSRLAGNLAAQGRSPVAGDFLRVECFSPQDQEGRVAEGFLEGAGGGELLLSVGLQSQTVAVPVVNVTRVEVRGNRTRKGVGGLIGTLLGAAGGALFLESKYDPDRRDLQRVGKIPAGLHWTREIYIGAGAVLGAFSGLIVGNIVGSHIKTDAWLDAPQDWVVQYSESGSTTPEATEGAMGCLGA